MVPPRPAARAASTRTFFFFSFFFFFFRDAEGPRWRYVYRQSDGAAPRRGAASSSAVRRAAHVAARLRAATASAARAIAGRAGQSGAAIGSVATSDTFDEFWAKLLEAKRPYVTAGTLQDYTTHGVKRLLPWFGGLRLSTIDEDRVRNWLSEMAELVADGELSAKTVNNARTLPVR